MPPPGDEIDQVIQGVIAFPSSIQLNPMDLLNECVSATVNLIVFLVTPFSFYAAVQYWRNKRTMKEILERVGLQVGGLRYLGYSAVFAAILVGCIIVLIVPSSVMQREGSAMGHFVGLGIDSKSIAMALIYGCLKTGLSEEFFFRGLIAGSLSRRMSTSSSNLLQAGIFLLPHALLIFIMPELWWLVVAIFPGALIAGWIRIKSESILGSWLIHSAVNVTTCLSLASQT